jgi:hypothetical protein
MAKKKRAAQSRSAEPDDCNADILPARSKKSRDDDKQDAVPEAADDAAAAPQSRRARKVNAVFKFAATAHFVWLWC